MEEDGMLVCFRFAFVNTQAEEVNWLNWLRWTRLVGPSACEVEDKSAKRMEMLDSGLL